MDKVLYRLGIFLFIAGIIVSIMQNFGVINLSQLLYPCLFHQITGLFCPGCGGTRAFTSLLQGRFISCFVYHPFVFYCFVMYVLFMTSHTLEKLYISNNKKKAPNKSPFAKGLPLRIGYVYFGIVIILLQWMIKNIFLLLINNN